MADLDRLERQITTAYQDLVQMVSAERDARRDDVRAIRDDLQRIDRRMEAGDARTAEFETAMLREFARFHAASLELITVQRDVIARLEALEAWRKQQAS